MTLSIGVSAAGDPRSGSTWSGTPKALVDASERLGQKVVTLSGQFSPRWQNLLYAPAVARDGLGARRFRHYYGPAFRRNVTEFQKLRESYENLPFLHTDHLWLDPNTVGKNDFLYRDCGWSTWARSRGLSERLTEQIGHRFKALVNAVGHTFTTSEWAKREIVADGANPENVTVVGTGVGNLIEPYFGEKDYSNGATLCVAKVRHYDKGIDVLTKGFDLARKSRPDLTLHLVVPPKSVRPAAGLHLYHNLPAEDLVKLYRMAALYAMPARNEPYGLVYLEAQLAGMALLGSSHGAFPEFADNGQHGFVVDELTPDAVASALLKAHTDPAQLQTMGSLGRKQAMQASWDGTMSRILARMSDPEQSAE